MKPLHALALLAVLLLYGLASEMDYRDAIRAEASAEEARARRLASLAAATQSPATAQAAATTHRSTH